MPKYFTMATIAPNQGCSQTFYGKAEFEKFEQVFSKIGGYLEEEDEDDSIIDTVFGVQSKLTF